MAFMAMFLISSATMLTREINMFFLMVMSKKEIQCNMVYPKDLYQDLVLHWATLTKL